MRRGIALLLMYLCVSGAAGIVGGKVARAATVAPYYVEFRAVEIGVYGHSYIAYGRLNANGQPSSVQYADFHPKGGNVGLVVGHLLPVGAAVVPEKETFSLPIVARYRHPLSEAEYRKLLAALAQQQTNPHLWNAIVNNCNTFVGEMAKAVGLRAPPSLMFAYQFVPALRSLNEGLKGPVVTDTRGPALPSGHRAAHPPGA
jgi:hypothetical protein